MEVAPAVHPHARRRIRLLSAWGLTAVLILGYALAGEEPDDEIQRHRPLQAGTATTDARLDIVEVDPSDPTPGSAIQVRFIGADTNPTTIPTLGAQLSQANHDYKAAVQVLGRRDDLLILRVPASAFAGHAKLRLLQGDEKSKPYDLDIEPVNRRKTLRSIVGGLALLLFGLTLLSSGTRAYAGRHTRLVLARISGKPQAALALGVAIGGVAQFTTAAAGLVVGLIDSHLLASVPATAILIGAQLGAAATPSVLGLASTREGLLITTIGVIWLGLAPDRRSRAVGKMVLGCGLMFYGLHVLRIGFEPLVSDPELLPHIELFNSNTPLGLLACVLAGSLIAALLQSPAPVFVIVLGLAEATGRLDLQSALAILAGTGIGAAVSTAVVASPFGPEARRTARLYLTASLLAALFLISTVKLWAMASDALVSGSPSQIEHGKKVMLPNFARHLVIGFVLSQATAALLLSALLPALSKLVERVWPKLLSRRAVLGMRISQRPIAPALSPHTAPDALRRELARVLALQQRALESALALSTSGDRALSTDSEHALSDARDELELLFSRSGGEGGVEGALITLRKAAIATLQLQRAAEELLRQTESSMERRLELAAGNEAPQLDAGDAGMLRAMHALLLEGLRDATDALSSGARPDLDRARAREISLNGLELDSRRELLAGELASDPKRVGLRLCVTDLVNAYETVGNHLYRLCEALSADVEQDIGPIDDELEDRQPGAGLFRTD